MMVGFKLWYADGAKLGVRIHGKTRAEVEADIRQLPTSGLQCMMVYYDEFSTVTCPKGHAVPFQPSRTCPICRAVIVDVAIRYRRSVSGNDHYFIKYDETPPTHLRDWLVGQSDKDADVARYPDAYHIAGGFVADTAFKVYSEQAMGDMNVSELGVTPVPGTSDL